ncbi:MAG: DMT family transporter [Actinomycetota bacterium]|nr:DMT family transporter [Actinomycetota bacterium]
MTGKPLLVTTHGTNREAFAATDWGLFISLGLIWGASFLFMAIGLDSFHPGLVTWLRVGFGALFMLALPRAHRAKVASEDWGKVIVLGVIWIALPLTLFPIAQQWIDSAVAGMLNGATPIFTALLATVLFRALPGRLQMAGLLIGFAGIIAIALPSAGAGSSQVIGVALVLLATVCYAFSLNVVPPLQQRYGALGVIARVQWVAALMVTPFGIYGLTKSTFAWPSVLAMLAVGIVGTGLAFVLMGTLSGRVGATRSAFITYVIPVVALILGVIFRNESIALFAILGVALVIVGALLASRRET